ncbi:hypothetical protein C1646_749178 [Rhizophagus diaphanus]|nr:hypothetical protein C1646_749178 [Rhizophagus diaphanus] [Rhizophagus sp. MUCL 43196]
MSTVNTHTPVSEINWLGLLSDDECKYFETKISENYSLCALGAQECPQNGEYAFCWYCLYEVKSSEGYHCNNDLCGGIDPRLAILKNVVKKKVIDVSGIPSCCACPKCGTIIEHDNSFICLGLRDLQTGWPYGLSNSVCDIAPIQTTIPGL